MTLTPYPLLVPWTRKGRAIPLLPLWAVRPIQSLSACIRVHFTLWAGYRSRYSDWLRAGRSGDRIPVGARFSALVQTGPRAHPASCTMGIGSFPVGKERPGRDADHSPPSNAVGHERVELYLYSPYGPYGLYRASVPVQRCTLPLPSPELESKLARNFRVSQYLHGGSL